MSATAATSSSSRRGGGEAYSGAPPGHVALCNTFDWCFSQPYRDENDYTPAAHRVPQIEDGRPIYVDNKSGEPVLLFVW